MNDTGIVILAAGNSSRFGSIKELLHFNNKTLIEHIINEAIDANLNPAIVVTGANANEISNTIPQQKIQIVFNEQWQQGMASGIVAGLSKLLSLNKNIRAVIIAVCDQPFVTSQVFHQLIGKQTQTEKNIVACAYADTIGTPALFTQKYCDNLLSLSGDEGAKKILKAHDDDVATIEFPQGNIDIDTQKDYEDLLDRQKHVL